MSDESKKELEDMALDALIVWAFRGDEGSDVVDNDYLPRLTEEEKKHMLSLLPGLSVLVDRVIVNVEKNNERSRTGPSGTV